MNVDSGSAFLKQLIDTHPLKKKFKVTANPLAKILNNKHSLYEKTFHTAGIRPNDWQFCIAQFSALLIETNPQKIPLWNIPSGQGKSRVIAALVLILLL